MERDIQNIFIQIVDKQENLVRESVKNNKTFVTNLQSFYNSAGLLTSLVCGIWRFISFVPLVSDIGKNGQIFGRTGGRRAHAWYSYNMVAQTTLRK